MRRDDFPFPDEVSRTHLFAERIGPVCRPDLASRLVDGDGPAAHAVLPYTATRPGAWDDWRRITGTTPDPTAGPPPQQTLEHFYLTLQAAAAGVGFAIAP